MGIFKSTAGRAGRALDWARKAIVTAVNGGASGIVRRRLGIMMWFILIGFGLLGAAAPMNINYVVFKGELQGGFDAFDGTNAPPGLAKEVGYFAALNWSVFGAAIAPFIVWFGLSTVDAFGSTLRKLCDAGMIRTAGFRRVPYDALRAKWQRHMTRNRLFFIAVVAVVFAIMMYDWWSVVGRPILWPHEVRAPISDPVMEYDWSVSSIFAGSTVNPVALFLFGFFGYVVLAGIVPALTIAVTLCTIYYMFFVTTLRVDEDDAESQLIDIVAVPAEGENDRHFGFGAFSDLFHNFLLMSLFVLVGLWFMSVQNFYLRDLTSTDLYQFIVGEAGHYQRLTSGQMTLDDLWNWFIKPTNFYIANPQVAFTFLLYPFICVISVLGCWFVLRNRALQARTLSEKNAAKIAADYRVDVADFKTSLRAMQVWPIGWITSQKLLLLMAFMFCSLVSFRLIIIPAVVAGFSLGAVLVKLIIPRSSN